MGSCWHQSAVRRKLWGIGQRCGLVEQDFIRRQPWWSTAPGECWPTGGQKEQLEEREHQQQHEEEQPQQAVARLSWRRPSPSHGFIRCSGTWRSSWYESSSEKKPWPQQPEAVQRVHQPKQAIKYGRQHEPTPKSIARQLWPESVRTPEHGGR